MQIRAATPSDLAAVASCADLSFGSPRSPDNRVELALQIQEGSVHVICDAVQVLGYSSFSPNRDYLFVDAVAVLPRLYRQGLGTQLLAFAEKEPLAVHEWKNSGQPHFLSTTWLPQNRPLR